MKKFVLILLSLPILLFVISALSDTVWTNDIKLGFAIIVILLLVIFALKIRRFIKPTPYAGNNHIAEFNYLPYIFFSISIFFAILGFTPWIIPRVTGGLDFSVLILGPLAAISFIAGLVAMIKEKE